MASGDTLLEFTPFHNESPSSNPAALGARNLHPTLDFDAATNESAVFSAVVPRNYAGTTGLTVHVHYAMASAEAGNTDWDAQFERIGEVQDIDSDSFAAVQSTDDTTVPGTSGVPDIVDITFTDGAQIDSIAVGELFRIKVIRDAANDTAAGDAQVIGVEIEET